MYKIIGADQKEYGPVSAEQVRLWIGEGRVNGQTRVQLAGALEWKTVASLPEFAALFPPAPPAAPPLPPGAIHLPQHPQSRTNQMAVWALVTGIVGLFCCQFLGPLSVILGAVALGHLKHHPGERGTGMAIAGIVLGALAILILILAVLLAISQPELLRNLQNQMQQQSS